MSISIHKDNDLSVPIALWESYVIYYILYIIEKNITTVYYLLLRLPTVCAVMVCSIYINRILQWRRELKHFAFHYKF